MPARECSKTACSHPAVSTLTFVYEDSTAVLGPLSRSSEPHAYDLCRGHASALTAPRGWELLVVPGTDTVSDDLVALSDAVDPRRQQGISPAPPAAPAPPARPDGPRQGHAEQARADRGRHLHVIRSPHD